MQNINLNKFLSSNEISMGVPVYLRIYHVSNINKFLQLFGIGAYHTSVLILDTEYSYGSSPEGTSGIIGMTAGSLSLEAKEKIYLGNTLLNLEDIDDLIKQLSPFWPGSSYDPFKKNCNHFTKVFATKLLGGTNFPYLVNKFTFFGFLCSCMYKPSKILFGNVVQMKRKTQVKSNASSIDKNKNSANLMDQGVKLIHVSEKNEPEVGIGIDKIKVLSQAENNTNTNFSKAYNSNEVLISNQNNDKNTIEPPFLSISHQLIDDFIELDGDNSYLSSSNSQNNFLFNDEIITEINMISENRDIMREIIIHNPISFLNEKDIKKNIFSNLLKYFISGDNYFFQNKNYSKSILSYKYCLDMIDNLFIIINKSRDPLILTQNKNNHQPEKLIFSGSNTLNNCEYKKISQNYISHELIISNSNNLLSNHIVGNTFANEKSDEKCSIVYEKLDSNQELTSFIVNNSENLKHLSIKIMHLIVFCNQKLYLYSEIMYFIEKILTLDPDDWIARTKRGLYYYFFGNSLEAKQDLYTISSRCKIDKIQKTIEKLTKSN